MNKHAVASAFYLLTLIFFSSTKAEDWPTFLHDNHRSGVTAERLELPLTERWVYQALHEPQPAWPDPARQDFWHHHHDLRATVTYDRAFHLVGADDAVYFGSSGDDKVYALDARTGQPRWTFFTDGPVRLAPTVCGGRLYVGSDDGCVYCLSAEDGSLLWKHTVAEDIHLIPGNGRIISTWPVRIGLVVEAGTVYGAAGLFPNQGTFLFALDAEDGSVRWKEKLAVSPQGYMLASQERLYVPTGRTSPAIFARADGTALGEMPSAGGAYALLTEDVLVTGPGRGPKEISAADVKTKDRIATFGGLHMIVNGPIAYMQSETELSAFNRSRYLELSRQKNDLSRRHEKVKKQLQKTDRQAPQAEQLRQDLSDITAQLGRVSRQLKDCYLWTVECEYPYAMVLAGDTLFVGGENSVAAYTAETGRRVWNAPVEGNAHGLAVINGGLYVSTDKGRIHCFANRAGTARKVTAVKRDAHPHPHDDLTQRYAEAAKRIVQQTGISKGYCLVLGCGEGRLAYELAGLTDLKIVGVEQEGGKVAAARQAIDRAGLYGRVVVQHSGGTELPYTKYVANLIVSDKTLATGELPASPAQIFDLVRPCGGVVALALPADKYDQDKLKKWSGNSIAGWKVHEDDKLVLAWARREALPGAGEWTHMYAEPGNTACSGDELVKGEMALQWFGPPGPRDMIDRHHRNVPPLFSDGRLFVPGDCIVFAVDAYNGTILWVAGIPNSRRLGVFLDCGSMVVDEQLLYVVADDKCHRFDVQTGQRRGPYAMPQLIEDAPRDWGYIAYSGEVLFGSGRRKGASYTETSYEADNALWYRDMKLVVSDYLFALQKDSGDVLWDYRDGLIINTTITVGGGRIYFVQTDSAKALADKLGRMPAKDLFDGGEQHLVALNTKTGQVIYREKLDVSPFEEPVYLNYAMEVLLLSGSRLAGQSVRYHYCTFDARSGSALWSMDHGTGLATDGAHGEYNRHPTIIGETVYTWPYAYSLKTGTRIEGWKFDRRGHGCGGVSASAQCLFWRGANPWMYDLGPDGGPYRLNSVSRPGCWINIIPAGGLILIPEASSGCTCGFALQTSMAFVPK